MQFIFLPDVFMIVLFFILWPIFQVSAAFIAYKIPDSKYSPESFLFRERKWERGGRLYEKLFLIKRWKHRLPDGAAAVKGGYRKKSLVDYSDKGLEKFIIETCRAELTHLLAIPPFVIFGFFAPPVILLYMFIYALLVNLPCIIVQRYNRPILLRLRSKKLARKALKENFSSPSSGI